MEVITTCDYPDKINESLPDADEPIESAKGNISRPFKSDSSMVMDTSESTASLPDTLVSTEKGREQPLSLAPFDVLLFKNKFLEMVEELRIRRSIDVSNEKRIEELITDQHGLTQKLDEARSHSNALIKDHTCHIQELSDKHREELHQYNNEKAKSDAVQECRENELKALKAEMRAFHLAKHNLEKKIQEQERQIQLQNTSRENYLDKIAQIEEKSFFLFKMAEEINEQIARLEINVKQATELHSKLNYVNSHQTCELEQLQAKLKSCRADLVESRAKLLMSENSKDSSSERSAEAKLKSAEQQLKMQVDLCRHLQSQILSLRNEHQEVLDQLKVGHTLLERHIETHTKSMEDKGELERNLDSLNSEVKQLKENLYASVDSHNALKEKFTLEKETLERKVLDTEKRLTTLQVDHKSLQDSYELVEASNLALKRDKDMEIVKLKKDYDHLQKDMVTYRESSTDLESKVCMLREECQQLQSALDQCEKELARSEKKLKEKEELLVQKEEEINRINRMQNQKVVLIREVSNTGVLSPSEQPLLLSPSLPPPSLPSPSSLLPLQPRLSPSQLPPPPPSSSPICNPPQFSPEIITGYDEASKTHIQLGIKSPTKESTHKEIVPEENMSPPEPKRPRVEEESRTPLTQSSLEPQSTTSSKDSSKEIPSVEFLPPQSVNEEGCNTDACKETKETPISASEIKGEEIQVSVTEEIGGDSQLQFSPDFTGGNIGGFMQNTQMNLQIKRVETFLKMDRLKRQKL